MGYAAVTCSMFTEGGGGGGGGNLKINFFSSEMRFIQGVLALKVEGSVVI